MNAHQIENFVINNPPLYNKFFGIYSTDIDLVSLDVNKPAIILNTEHDEDKIGHWVAMYISNTISEYFDPLGKPPNENFENFLVNNSKQYIFSKLSVQGNESVYCGQFCLYFLLNRIKCISYSNIINSLNNNFHINDCIVQSFYQQYSL